MLRGEVAKLQYHRMAIFYKKKLLRYGSFYNHEKTKGHILCYGQNT